MQLLKLMYHQSRDVRNIKIPTRPTRAAEKVVLNVPPRCTTKYNRHIHMYVCLINVNMSRSLDLENSEGAVETKKITERNRYSTTLPSTVHHSFL